MQYAKTRGIIARRADYGESNAMITILTEELGAISAVAYGVRSKKSKTKAATQVLCFGEFVLSNKGGDIYRIDSVEIIDSFYPICEDITKLSLANYILELGADSLSDGDGRILSLILNTLYVICYKNIDIFLAKAVFELKLMQYAGYEPTLDQCIRCGKNDGLFGFDINSGVVCEDCKIASDINISVDLYRAMCYILSCDDKKIFSFSVTQSVGEELSRLCEKYILGKSERRYKSLEYFKKMI